MHALNFIPHGTMQAAYPLLNFHWFPPGCLCESVRQSPSIRKDVKYRARQTRIVNGGEGGRQKWRATPVAGKGQIMDKGSQRHNDKVDRIGLLGQINGSLNQIFNPLFRSMKCNLILTSVLKKYKN